MFTRRIRARCRRRVAASAAELADAVETRRPRTGLGSAKPAKAGSRYDEVLEVIAKEMRPLGSFSPPNMAKTVPDSIGDIQRGLEVVESAGAPHLLKGETTDSAGPGIDVYSDASATRWRAGIRRSTFQR